MRFHNLDHWLAWLEGLHPRSIDLGLERVQRVATAMGIDGLPCPVVTVAGTNGKGSSVAMLEAILTAAGYRVATYTSPHLLRYNERIRIAGREAGDVELCEVFERIDRARGQVTLTYFEFGTLAALELIRRAPVDVAILEVGMGGRLDAVNIVDSDVALVTSIGLDHGEWLGRDRDAIGAEKGGIFRPGRPAVCGDPDSPAGLLQAGAATGARLYCSGRDYGHTLDDAAGTWSWRGPGRVLEALPLPGLAGAFQRDNAAGVLMVLDLLAGALPVPEAALRQGLSSVRLAGRFQRIPGEVSLVLDVAHNAEGARALAETLAGEGPAGVIRAVAAILGDKDIDGMLSSLSETVHEWHVASLPLERTAPAERLRDCVVTRLPAAAVQVHDDVPAAYRAALSASQSGDMIVVFGSFYTVVEVLKTQASDSASCA